MPNHTATLRSAWFGCIFFLAACAGSSSSAERDASAVIQRWATAFKASDVETIVSLYAPDALFFGTGSKTLVTAPAEIRSYFEAALQRNRPRGAELLEHTVRAVSEDSVIVTGLDRISGTKDGVVEYSHGRVTFVLQKRGGSWQIVHFHRSLVPG